jgi:hypothetical protein
MKKNKKLGLVKVKGSVRQIAGTNQLLDDVTKQIEAYGNIEALKNDKDFLEHVCELVHNSESVKLEDTEKDDVVVEVLTKFFPVLNNERDRETIKNDSAWIRRKGIVKNITLLKRVSSSAFGWIKKKLL